MVEAAEAPATDRPRWPAIGAWCLYDWANSAFNTVVLTFVFSVYFAKGVVGDEAAGSGQWGIAIGLAGLIVAFTSPVLGAIADHAGARKPWLALFTAITVLATAALWFAEPDPGFALYVLALVIIASVTFEWGQVFYNAMLTGVAPTAMTGRISGWGWGLGYFGGLGCLALCLTLLIQPDPPMFGLDKGAQEPVRATALLVAVWFALFSLPLFLAPVERRGDSVGLGDAVARGLKQLRASLVELWQQRNLLRFLIASALYRDGLGTLFAVGGLYAAGTFGMEFDEILIFAIGLNVTAGLGAALFAWVDDWVGPKPTILLALAGLIGLGTATLLVTDKTVFMALALGLGIFVGPAQAASRSMLARLSDPAQVTEMFGLYALTGKSIAFLGPLLFGVVTTATDSQRWGMATIIVFLAAGALLLLTVRPPAKQTSQ
ncbi:MAG: MFS transporter [Alphaproteobacteria bacterium]|nr:MFS transporter [Alphaproteobacteria bacterium SS10]